jgi:hypothetical protein
MNHEHAHYVPPPPSSSFFAALPPPPVPLFPASSAFVYF